MAAVDPLGDQKYWFEGLPWEGLNKLDQGTQKYWFEGLSGRDLFPTGVPPAADPVAYSQMFNPLGINFYSAGRVGVLDHA